MRMAACLDRASYICFPPKLKSIEPHAHLSTRRRLVRKQDLTLSIKITDTRDTLARRLQDHQQQFFLEMQVGGCVGGWGV
jgi:hypothetical protein